MGCLHMCEHCDDESVITKIINMTISQDHISQKIYKIVSTSQYSSQHR
jgi:hypothetical protein